MMWLAMMLATVAVWIGLFITAPVATGLFSLFLLTALALVEV